MLRERERERGSWSIATHWSMGRPNLTACHPDVHPGRTPAKPQLPQRRKQGRCVLDFGKWAQTVASEPRDTDGKVKEGTLSGLSPTSEWTFV